MLHAAWTDADADADADADTDVAQVTFSKGLAGLIWDWGGEFPGKEREGFERCVAGCARSPRYGCVR
jgi:hypothetical protein